MPKILIIEDDTAFSQMLSRFLTKHRFEVTAVVTLKDAISQIQTTFFEIVLSDVRLPEGDGVSLLSTIKKQSPQTQIIMMTGYAEVKTAVKAMKKGAFDYISKPFTPESILQIINEALKNVSNKGKDIKNSAKGKNRATGEDFVLGESESSQKLQHYLQLVAPTQMSVLLTGESGTGKEVTARAIHNASSRKTKKFIAVDCGAVPKEIASSEFFGHIKGSFTGAVEDKIGHFEAANGGTLFLDEIGNLSYENQVQLLRALQERRIKRVGSTQEVHVDVRIISATNEDLRKAVAEGRFREDLYHRLNEFSIAIPALRERENDLLQFAEAFLQDANAEIGRQVDKISEETKMVLLNYAWPGNLRELKNSIKRAVLFSEGTSLEVEALPEHIKTNIEKDTKAKYFSKSSYEKERILEALKQTNFNKSKAAELLQITRKTLYNKINLYQLDV
ncbi:sigma-54-dependent transcriptional regulator [Flagellimonas sp.]|uniref:sigma-54-dependent transcriptional regulator n=1 Tax=Flagellimonas sp. TaxID=2058762 RepID=UPI003F49B6FE